MKCEYCWQSKPNLKTRVVAWHYSIGPIRQLLCSDCWEIQKDSGLKNRSKVGGR